MSTSAPSAVQDVLPRAWPHGTHPGLLDAIDHATPFLAFDTDVVIRQLTRFRSALPGFAVHYAMKCNGEPEILRRLHDQGTGFEIASIGELDNLESIGVSGSDVLFSNPVKAPAAIRTASAAGVWRFSFDSLGELEKIASVAPASAVYLRLRVDDSDSVFPLSRKFGATAEEGYQLLLHARDLGLQPYGLTFHVGSQCTRTSTWDRAIAAVGRLMRRLSESSIELSMLDIGGGFPVHYGSWIPSIGSIGSAISTALNRYLPYYPELLVAEPGRFLVAESAVLVSSVLGRAVRDGRNWLYLDVGAYNGLMECLQTAQTWEYPLSTSLSEDVSSPLESFTVTGPSCDSSDTMFNAAVLPAAIDVGAKIYIGSAGAYTLSYASAFNGFPLPAALEVAGLYDQ